LEKPTCELWGEELAKDGKDLTVDEVFQRVTEHNRKLDQEDRFSTEPLHLVYKANNVQNMRFVDTPGIISNISIGKDNREDIKEILRSEMQKPNTKLCVLLEPKEFATNTIVDFCDSCLGGREKWIHNATFLMAKFDKQLNDSRTGSKANNFFKLFHENNCFPHLVITPTLAKEDLPPQKLYEARQKLLTTADVDERTQFRGWRDGHDLFRTDPQNGGDEVLDVEIQSRIGFASAKKVMREIMLVDTAKRIPEVLAALRAELDKCRKEHKTLKEKMKFTDPAELRTVVTDMVFHLQKRVLAYLDGDLESARKFPAMLQTLEDEIEEEEDSEWAEKELNYHTEKEIQWRSRIANLDEYPEELQAETKYLGGKQYQRAIAFFRIVMIEALPDPYELKDLAANGTGYLGGGLQRENWERAMVQITKVCMKDVTHPGINYLVKHVGSILRRLFSLALEDIKKGEEFSSTFKLLPSAVEKYLFSAFDTMLWDLMKDAANKTHCAMEPMYTTINPNLPTFHASNTPHDNKSDEETYVLKDGIYVKVPSKKENSEEGMISWAKNRLSAMVSGTGEQAKQILRSESKTRATSKKAFLSDERTSMITVDETDQILRRSFEYIVALMEFNMVIFTFQLNHYLYQRFKDELGNSFIKTITYANWDTLCIPDPNMRERLEVLEDQIAALSESLKECDKMNMRM
jgi:hypothetical protein